MMAAEYVNDLTFFVGLAAAILAAVAFGAVTFVKGKWRSSWAANGVRI